VSFYYYLGVFAVSSEGVGLVFSVAVLISSMGLGGGVVAMV